MFHAAELRFNVSSFKVTCAKRVVMLFAPVVRCCFRFLGVGRRV